MYTPDQMLSLARAYGSHIGRSLRYVAARATNEHNKEFLVRLAQGCSCRVETLVQASVWFDAAADRAWWPDGVPFPVREAAE